MATKIMMMFKITVFTSAFGPSKSALVIKDVYAAKAGVATMEAPKKVKKDKNLFMVHPYIKT